MNLVLIRWTSDSFAITGWGWVVGTLICGGIADIARRHK